MACVLPAQRPQRTREQYSLTLRPPTASLAAVKCDESRARAWYRLAPFVGAGAHRRCTTQTRRPSTRGGFFLGLYGKRVTWSQTRDSHARERKRARGGGSKEQVAASVQTSKRTVHHSFLRRTLETEQARSGGREQSGSAVLKIERKMC
eukprot:1074304-Pleurochrysis_carterae.AAC.1